MKQDNTLDWKWLEYLEKAEKEGNLCEEGLKQLERMRTIAQDENRERFCSPIVDDVESTVV